MPRQRTFRINLITLDRLMEAKGWVSADLAEKAAISTRTVDSIMDGNGIFMCTLRKIAKAFGVPIPYLIKKEVREHPSVAMPHPINRFPVVIKVNFDDETQAIKFIEGIAQLIGARQQITIEEIIQEAPKTPEAK